MTHKLPDWLKNAVFYEIYPQSFKDTNGDGIGDLKGITESLDYIQSLGFNAIWMNPCFVSPFMDAGYDVEDYYSVAPRYGNNQDMKDLLEAVHKRGMHLILDLVAGHTAYTHPWFQASMKAEKNEFTDRYVWTDKTFAMPPEGFQCLRGISDRNGAAIVNFFSTQPALNYGFYKPDPKEPWQQAVTDPGPVATKNELKSIMRFWLSMGCDGFRVDMAQSLVKNDPDSYGTIAFWQGMRKFMDKEFPEAILVSEWGEPDKAIAGGFDMDFLLHFGPSHYTDLYHCDEPYFSQDGKGSAKAFVKKYNELAKATNGLGLISIPSGNHDMPRMAHYCDDEERRLVFMFLMTMPGTPFVYYGDEIGMRYLPDLTSKEGGFERTGARTPMQWDHMVNAGFSAAAKDKLYLPLDPDKDRPTVEAALKDENSLLHEIKKLIALRKEHPALQSFGNVNFVNDDIPLAYTRSNLGENITVVLNPSDQEVSFPVEAGRILYSIGEAGFSDGKVTLGKVSGAVLM